jgi:hypothetical protein
MKKKSATKVQPGNGFFKSLFLLVLTPYQASYVGGHNYARNHNGANVAGGLCVSEHGRFPLAFN